MSVIIKDMEMPKTCSQCEIWSKCWDERPFWFERLEFCPLTEMSNADQHTQDVGSVGADRKTENSSEVPNNCEECKHWNDTEDGCADRHECRATTEDWQDWKDKMWSEAVVTEPTTEDCSTVPTSSILEQVDEPQTERSGE